MRRISSAAALAALTALVLTLGSAPTATASDAERVLYNFTGYSDGGGPIGGLVADSSGNLYGTTTSVAGGRRLGRFLAYEMGLTLKQMTCVAAYAPFSGGTRGGARHFAAEAAKLIAVDSQVAQNA